MPEKDKEKTMPHVIVKLWPGKAAQQKTRRAGAIAKDVIEVLHDGEASVPVAFEEAISQDWHERYVGQTLQKTGIHDVHGT